MQILGRTLMTRRAPALAGAYRHVPLALSPIAALGAQTGAIVDANGQPVPKMKHIATSAGIGAVSGGAAGAAVGALLGGGLFGGALVGALSGAVGNATLALLGLD